MNSIKFVNIPITRKFNYGLHKMTGGAHEVHPQKEKVKHVIDLNLVDMGRRLKYKRMSFQW